MQTRYGRKFIDITYLNGNDAARIDDVAEQRDAYWRRILEALEPDGEYRMERAKLDARLEKTPPGYSPKEWRRVARFLRTLLACWHFTRGDVQAVRRAVRRAMRLSRSAYYRMRKNCENIFSTNEIKGPEAFSGRSQTQIRDEKAVFGIRLWRG